MKYVAIIISSLPNISNVTLIRGSLLPEISKNSWYV
jgi:hypothetical protein